MKAIFQSSLLFRRVNLLGAQVRCKCRDVDLPPNFGPYSGKYRRIVHYPEEYTVKPLNVTNLAGRDPLTGRVLIQGIGGGIKHKYHWINWKREGPTEGPPLVEKVIQIMEDGCRTSKIALIASGDKLKYYLATENMKAGDLIKTSQYIPKNAVAANEGDAHPLGALPPGTVVCNIEKYPNKGGFYCHSAGTSAVILSRSKGRVIIQLPSKREVSLVEDCMATVGRISNVEHGNTPIGSAQRSRELGNRPRSGLWHRKDGRHGRKIKPLPPILFVNDKQLSNIDDDDEEIKLTLNNDMYFNLKLY